MSNKFIIFDLDNTLYNYDICHHNAIKNIIETISLHSNIDYNLCLEAYNDSNNSLKKDLLKNTAASHSKLLSFKLTLEKLNVKMNYDVLDYIYWNIFNEHIKPFDGVDELLSYLKENNYSINILSDYTLKHQIMKLNRLDLYDYFDNIITSEEIGIEKPNRLAFEYCRNKLNAIDDQIIMVGDSFEKDVIGAVNNNMYAYWYNDKTPENKHQINRYETVHSYEELLDRIKTI